MATGSQTAIMTTTSRMPVSGAPNHQPITTRVVTATTANNLTRFPASAPSATTRTTTNTSQQLIAATTTTRLTSTASQPTGIVVHPQIMVNATKSVVQSANHMTTRPVQIHNASTGQKVSKHLSMISFIAN